MQTNLSKNIEKIFTEFGKLSKLSKAIIKYGVAIFFALFALGTGMVVINHVALGFDSYYDLIATSLVKTSFTILAEVMIGGLLMDYFFRKEK